MDIQTMKAQACAAIDAHREEIIALGESIRVEPELGYKEYKTSAKVRSAFDKLGLPYERDVALTGVIARLPGRQHKATLAIMGELDAVVCPGHPQADPVTGAAHACGHFAQIAAVIGAAAGLKYSGVSDLLDGDIEFWATPAEEAGEVEWRKSLIDQGKISFLGGKQEMIKLGYLDHVDVAMMIHSGSGDKCAVATTSNGFVAKYVHYIGKEAHAGGAPHLGVNALNAANLGLMAIHAQRETFKNEDTIRVHPIITKGGDLVNVVPADVRIETFCRANNMEAIQDASMKVNRALKAGADAVGAEVEIVDIPGYMTPYECPEMKAVVEDNLALIYGKENVVPGVGYTTEANDVAHLIPVVHCTIGGAEGIAHSSHYEIRDKDSAYIKATKMLLCSAIDLLANGAEKGLSVKKNFKAPMTKEEYLRTWGHLDV